MKILAIESSCDETACAVIEGDDLQQGMTTYARPRLLSNMVVSQVDIFAEYGGVIPEVAARSHLEAILPVVHKALADADCTKEEIDVIAVTHTPGLLGSLLIGTLTARLLAVLWNKPLYAVHHLKSHIYANWLGEGTSEPKFPLLALVVSGGHTQIIYMRAHNEFEIIGTTRDDAVGECFDKVAKILGLPYPGGPAISEAAAKLKASAPAQKNDGWVTDEGKLVTDAGEQSKKCSDVRGIYTDKTNPYHLPIPQVDGLDFSFSGLKTAVLRSVQHLLDLPITTPSAALAKQLTDEQRANYAASFQQTAVEFLLDKLQLALEQHPDVKSVVLAGGVSANGELREQALKFGERNQVEVYYPELKYAGDNAAMVGAAAYYEILAGVEPVDPYSLDIAPRTPIG